MSGADVAPLEEQAVTELHKLFSWVHKSRKGVLLFIDEADAFLKVRDKNMSETMRNAITTMLYHTGTETSQFLMVLATNRPGDLDPAVLDRIDESVEFGLPDLPEREKICKQYMNLYVTKPLKIQVRPAAPRIEEVNKKGEVVATKPRVTTKDDLNQDVDEDTLIEVARQLKTFSGREISKLFTGLQTHICAHMSGGVRTRNLRLTKGALLDIVRNKVEEHNRTLDVLARGYAYVHKEGSSTMTPLADRSLGTGVYGGLSASGSKAGPPSKQQSAQSNFLQSSAQQQNININIQHSGSGSTSQSPTKSKEEIYADIYGRSGIQPPVPGNAVPGQPALAGEGMKGDGQWDGVSRELNLDGGRGPGVKNLLDANSPVIPMAQPAAGLVNPMAQSGPVVLQQVTPADVQAVVGNPKKSSSMGAQPPGGPLCPGLGQVLYEPPTSQAKPSNELSPRGGNNSSSGGAVTHHFIGSPGKGSSSGTPGEGPVTDSLQEPLDGFVGMNTPHSTPSKDADAKLLAAAGGQKDGKSVELVEQVQKRLHQTGDQDKPNSSPGLPPKQQKNSKQGKRK